MFKGLSNLASLMANAGELKAKAAEVKDRIAAVRVEGSSGGGMVKVDASGDHRILSITIEETLLVSNDKEMLEDLILAATNQALDLAKKAAASEMTELAGGLGIPGLEDAISKFGASDSPM
ncbi:YbaB/EbfC family nucleoid-associated protein [Thalassoglobus polymorphus]|uniref:Nucleoid-associated protein Mal48_38710 n=1 Tax=Thalassoglobus polymorphus TaxID=2527994 RepID=A0A517QSJ7_9PLAN|nr:YbaB/EbfC family nucleoid-associated protein [Thalassoglobus polymorphus]QDT34608.1 Nucleoid-associated protein [Thalassoglobus polymorphus]